MTPEQRASYLKTAMQVAGFSVDDYSAELIMRLNDLVIEKQGETDLKSMVAIKCEVKDKHFPKEDKA